MTAPTRVFFAFAAVGVAASALADSPAPAAAADEARFVPIFNGQDLEGWAGAEGRWRVESGAIVGESTAEHPIDHTQYLFWEGGEPSDFVLRAKLRLFGGNSGIQFRSKRLPSFDADGYQADYDADGAYVGCLYQPARHIFVTRGVRATIGTDAVRAEERFADPETLLEGFDPREWHEYEIDARGTRLALRIDGKTMCEADDHDPEHSLRSGVIALQIHQGPPMRVEYRDVRLWDLAASKGEGRR